MNRVTLLPFFALLPARGVVRSTRPPGGPYTLPTWRPTAWRRPVASGTVSPIRLGTTAGPFETITETVEPRSTLAPAPGDVPTTWSLGTVSLTSSVRTTFRPSRVRAALAASKLAPATLGTVRGVGP